MWRRPSRLRRGHGPVPGRGSAGGEGVVAELGQDVHRLADDLAGLGEGGALAVDAFLDLRVVGVVGAPARAWALPAS